MGLHYQKLRDLGVEVLVIGGGPPSRAQAMAKKLRLPFPVLNDPDRGVYKRYSLSKKLVLIQQSGTVLVDKDGVIRYVRRFTNPQAWIGSQEIGSLVEAASRLAAVTP